MGARALELGLEARPMLYPAVVEALAAAVDASLDELGRLVGRLDDVARLLLGGTSP